MRIIFVLLIGFVLHWMVGTGLSEDRLIRESDPLPAEAQQLALQVPDGFEISLFAAEPMINKPINLAFDARGRLWVTSTVEYPYSAAKERWVDERGTRVRNSRDAIKILEDTDGDGRADRVTDFADGLNIPTGILPWHREEHQDGCIAWSIPNIWYFADTTGDGRADHREVLFGPLGYEKDTHGMCSSFRMEPGDGWVYATHGFNNTSHFRGRDGSSLDLNSGNVFRFRPDGSRVEIWSWGQVNPFGLTFDRRGNLYSADCHSAPVYQLLQGAVYPSFSKPHDGLGFGPSMIEHTHGSTGICGIVYIDREYWGSEWNDQVLIGNPVTSRVNRDRIEFIGSTPSAVEEPEFVVSSDPWFRPVDLCLGPDGALYIADFYNRIIGHYEVPLDHPGRDRERGRIWRVVKKTGTVDPDRKPSERIPVQDAIKALQSDSPFLRREAAAALRNRPRLEALEALWVALKETPVGDTHLRHALRMAIREHLRLKDGFDYFSWTPVDREIASIALAVATPEAAEYIDRTLSEGASDWDGEDRKRALGHIARQGELVTVERLVARERKRTGSNLGAQISGIEAIQLGLEEREIVMSVPGHHAWAGDLARSLLIEREKEGPAMWVEVPQPNGSTEGSPGILQTRKCSDGSEATILSSLRRGEKGAEQKTGVLKSREFVAPRELSFWVCGHRGFPDQQAHDRNRVRLVNVGTGEKLASVFPPRSDVCQKVIWNLKDAEGVKIRLEIIDGDAGRAYAWIGITRIKPEVIDVDSFREGRGYVEELAKLATMLKMTAPVDLRDQLKGFLPSAPAPPPLPVSLEERDRLERLIRERSEAFNPDEVNLVNGEAVFRTHCAVCHQVGGDGGLIGPQLDGVGSRGVARLCEDILDPNRNVDAHFRLTSIPMKDGSVLGGFVINERGEVLHLIDTSGSRHRIPRSEITKRETTALSVMPPVFDRTIQVDDFRDLLGWLSEK